jgi:hypothetical protein
VGNAKGLPHHKWGEKCKKLFSSGKSLFSAYFTTPSGEEGTDLSSTKHFKFTDLLNNLWLNTTPELHPLSLTGKVIRGCVERDSFSVRTSD